MRKVLFRERVQELYKEGKSKVEIQDILKCSRYTVMTGINAIPTDKDPDWNSLSLDERLTRILSKGLVKKKLSGGNNKKITQG